MLPVCSVRDLPGLYPLEGASIEADNNANKKLYGKELGAKEIVTGSQEVVPAAKPLVSLLDTTSPHRK